VLVLINWACGALLLALGVGVWARAARGCPAAVRYRVWWAALVAILAMPAAAIGTGGSAPSGAAPVAAVVELPADVALAGPLVLILWAAWAALAATRLGVALLALRRVKRSCLPFPPARQARLTCWQAVRGSGRRARLMLSPAVGSAAVLGGAAPVIAVSPLLLRHLDDADLDRIVLHEWAHVQRRDDVAQLLQEVIRALLGFHPAVWWAARQLRLECELACDERVAEVTGSAKRYAACLARLAGVMTAQRETALLPAALTSSQMTIRITRLVRQPLPMARPRSLALAGAVLVAAAFAAAVRVPLVGELTPSIDPVIASPGLPTRNMTPERTAASAVPAVEPARLSRPDPTPRRAVRPPRSASPRPGGDAVLNTRSDVQLRGGRAGASPLASPPAASPDVPRLTSGPPGVTGVPAMALPMTAPVLPEPAAAATRPSPWSAAAGAGVAIGRETTNAARGTAGFFTRMGKSIGGAF